MSDLLAATANPGKLKEITEVLSAAVPGISVFHPGHFGIREIPEEKGETFLENSREKAVFYSRKKRGICTLADDSGLAVDALGGLPGVHSARYSGPESDDHRNVEKLLKELKGESRRKARFICVLTLSFDGRVIRYFTGEVSGMIAEERRGTGGFGYDPVFFYPPLGKTFGELNPPEKNRISHRAAALNLVKKYLLANPGVLHNGLP